MGYCYIEEEEEKFEWRRKPINEKIDQEFHVFGYNIFFDGIRIFKRSELTKRWLMFFWNGLSLFLLYIFLFDDDGIVLKEREGVEI